MLPCAVTERCGCDGYVLGATDINFSERLMCSNSSCKHEHVCKCSSEVCAQIMCAGMAMSGSTSKPCQYNHAASFYMPTIAFVSRETHQAYLQSRDESEYCLLRCCRLCLRPRLFQSTKSYRIRIIRAHWRRPDVIVSIHKHTIEIAGRCV